MNNRLFSPRTVNDAVNSPDGPRLEEITKEHICLAKQYVCQYFALSRAERFQIVSRIKALRKERDNILMKYEEAQAECSGGGSSVPLSPA